MQKKGIFLPQQTNETCGISCILMALMAFGKIKKPRENLMDEKSTESIFYEMYGFETPAGTRLGTLGGAIAYALSCRRLHAQIWHASEALMENKGGYFPEALHEKMLRDHRGWMEKAGGSVPLMILPDLAENMQRLADALDGEHLLIVQCLVKGDADGMHDHVLHWILVFDYRDGEFLAYDPQYQRPSKNAPNYITISKEDMMAYMNTPVGAAVICVGERK